MNLNTAGIIIRREYLNKVKKKSFLVTTFIVPILFAGLCILPSLIMLGAKEEGKKIAVADRSGIVSPFLEDSETIDYESCRIEEADSIKSNLGGYGFDAILFISELNEQEKKVTADIYSAKPLGIDMSDNITNRVNAAVEAYRIESYGIDGLETIMQEVRSNIKLKSYTLDDEGRETITESSVYMIVSMILGIIIYMFIALFGSMVMTSVIEEKSSRVVEVLVSSVKATELLFGKIVGVALVALTQFFLWIVLTFAIIGVVGAVVGQDFLAGADAAELVQMSGISADQAETITSAVSEPGEVSIIFSTLHNLPFGQIIVCFVLFFAFGYMLYASVFAAIGSAGESEADTQQLQLPVTIPLMIGFFIAIYAFKAPDSALVFWGSMIPFTSPIVMLARLPFGVAGWEIGLSIALLIAAFVLCAWASAKIYKVGILMFGKKSTWKDLWKWFKQK